MVVPVSSAAAVDDINTKKLRDAVTVSGILGHERALQRIANQNGGTRASGTPGYDASAAYVKSKLEKAGYKVTEQSFQFPYFEEVSAATFAQTSPTAKDYEVATLEYSGSADVTGELVPTNDIVIPPTPAPSSTSGCEAADFAPATGTQIALVQRGTCTFAVKAENASAAGYAEVAIFNEGQPGRDELLTGTLGAPPAIAVIGLDFADGSALYSATQAGPVTVSLRTDTLSEERTTKNVIADSPKGNP